MNVNKIPPQNIDAEQSLLAAILIDNDVFDDVIQTLSASHFHRSAHGLIFNAMIELHEKGEPIDLITLVEILQRKDWLEKVGGAVYLSKLVDEVPLAVNATHYAKIIYDKSVLRTLIKKGQAIINLCMDQQGEVDDIIDYAEGCLFEISNKRISPDYCRVNSLLAGSYDTLVKREQNKGMPTGVPSGINGLDSLTSGFQKSDLTILAARPSMGKTAFALNIARNAAVESNVPVAFFSLEMSKEQLAMRLLCAESRVNSDRFRDGFLSAEHWQSINRACGILHEAPIFIDDSTESTVLTLRAKARRLKLEHDIGLVIIDYLQLMNITRYSERRDLDISEISKGLKNIARELEIPVIALSQLNRQLERREDKRPRLSDIRESGSIEQDADVVAFIHREGVIKKPEGRNVFDTRVEIIVAKHRNGPTGSVKLAFIKHYSRFENLAIESQ